MKTRFYTTRGIPTIAREILGAQTSDTSPFIVSDNSGTAANSTHSPRIGFDSMLNNISGAYGWISNIDNGTGYWQIDFLTQRYITGFSIIGTTEPNGYYNMGSFIFAGSNDGITFATLAQRTTTTRISSTSHNNTTWAWNAFSIPSNLQNWYRYYRITINKPTGLAGGVNGIGFREIKFTELTYN